MRFFCLFCWHILFNRRHDQGCDPNGLKFQFFISHGLQEVVIPSTFRWLARIGELTYNIHLHSSRNLYKWYLVLLPSNARRMAWKRATCCPALPAADPVSHRETHAQWREKEGAGCSLCVLSAKGLGSLWCHVMIFFFTRSNCCLTSFATTLL